MGYRVGHRVGHGLPHVLATAGETLSSRLAQLSIKLQTAYSESVFNLFNLLNLFERCSGLKINETKSEMLWLGSCHHRKDKILNLSLGDKPIYVLDVQFSYDRKATSQKQRLG